MTRVKAGIKVDQLEIPEVPSSNELWRGLAHVYVKAQRATGMRLILHEYLAARLANFSGIPVPFGDITSLPENREAWVSGITTRDGKVLPPPKFASLVSSERHVLSGILVFDQWIFNGDRDERNLVWSSDIGLWAIDHELAFCGDRESDAAEWLDDNHGLVLRYAHLATHGLNDADFKPWIDHIQAQGAAYAERATESARKRGLGTQASLKPYKDFLIQRAARVRTLMSHSLAASGFAPGEARPENRGLF